MKLVSKEIFNVTRLGYLKILRYHVNGERLRGDKICRVRTRNKGKKALSEINNKFNTT